MTFMLRLPHIWSRCDSKTVDSFRHQFQAEKSSFSWLAPKRLPTQGLQRLLVGTRFVPGLARSISALSFLTARCHFSSILVFELSHLIWDSCIHRLIYIHIYHESQLSSMAKLLTANKVRIGGLGGGRLQTSTFHAFPHLIRVASVVDFAAYVPGGNCVTVGFDSPLVRPLKCIWVGWIGG